MTWTQEVIGYQKKWFWTYNDSILDMNRVSKIWIERDICNDIFLVFCSPLQDGEDINLMGKFTDKEEATSYLEIIHKYVME